MHHIIVTTLISSEYRTMNETRFGERRSATSFNLAGGVRSVADRVHAKWMANRRAEPRATSLDQCDCACQPTRT